MIAPSRPKFTVAVTGVGALIGQGIARGLRADGRARIVGIDRRANLAAQAECHEIICKPDVDENSIGYLDFWRNLICDHEVDLILPGIGIDVGFLDRNRESFHDLPVVLGLNTGQLIDLATDKLRLAQAYATLDLQQIPTVEPTTWADALTALGPPPILRKPRRGEGSSGLCLLHDERDFSYWTKEDAGSVILQRVVGHDAEEYTVGTFGLGDGSEFPPIVMRRRLTRSGHTGEAEIITSNGKTKDTKTYAVLVEATQKLVAHFKPIGPTNLQFRIEDGQPYLLEINPRFSSSCSLRTLFGYNEAAMCIDFFLEGRRPADPTVRAGRAERYSADLVSYARPDL
jgi:carbamoyl-phosphate synthase large subunit